MSSGFKNSVEFKCHCVGKRNQSAEDLICDHHHGGNFKFFARRNSLDVYRKAPAKCFDVLLEKVEGNGDCP
jgi:hypothetical protein